MPEVKWVYETHDTKPADIPAGTRVIGEAMACHTLSATRMYLQYGLCR